MTKERPILFSGPMARAILDGRKTQTRRIIKWPNKFAREEELHKTIASVNPDGDGNWIGWSPRPVTDEQSIKAYPNGGGFKCPYGKPGDRLWVRESWCIRQTLTQAAYYRATEPNASDKWKPSIHMPHWASRITLEVKSVRVERLQDISEDDAIAEGIKPFPISPSKIPVMQYQDLWESINGPGSWEANPWVWVIEFKRINP